MCGIVGVLGKEDVAPVMLEALRRLEYRGYDSAGVATLVDGGIDRRRAVGKLSALAAALEADPISGSSGIGHTRWATHGAPTERNAHPHATERVAIVHNGIIENYRDLRQELEEDGYEHETETDTEVVVQLATRFLDQGLAPFDAARETLKRLDGAFALCFLFKGADDLLIAARRGSPLAIGYGDGEMFVGSDALALAPLTQRICYLEEGDWAAITRDGAQIFDADGRPANREVHDVAISSAAADKGPYRHFMLKEIHEQPTTAVNILNAYVSSDRRSVAAPIGDLDLGKIDRMTLSACGTAFYACKTAEYWIERLAGVPVDVDIASEFRYREAPLSAPGAALFVSQSGETADTLAALRHCAERQLDILAVVNVGTSSIAREAGVVLETLAGPEIGVASTKAFTGQLLVLAAIAMLIARAQRAARRREGGRAARRSPAAADPDARGAEARRRGAAGGGGARRRRQRALSRPRRDVPAGARRRAEAQGDLLHPRRGLRGRRAEARADRAHRRDHAGGRDRAARRAV